MNHSTKKKGWTEEQLKALGIQWPPKGKWKREIINTVYISTVFGTTEWIRTTDPHHVKVVL